MGFLADFLARQKDSRNLILKPRGKSNNASRNALFDSAGFGPTASFTPGRQLNFGGARSIRNNESEEFSSEGAAQMHEIMERNLNSGPYFRSMRRPMVNEFDPRVSDRLDSEERKKLRARKEKQAAAKEAARRKALEEQRKRDNSDIRGGGSGGSTGSSSSGGTGGQGNGVGGAPGSGPGGGNAGQGPGGSV